MADNRFYQKSGPFTLLDIAVFCGATLAPEANPAQIIVDVASLEKAGDGHISCFHNSKYADQFKNSRASACLVTPAQAEHAPAGMALLLTPQPYRAYGKVATLFYPPYKRKNGISPLAAIHSSAKIGQNCSISPFVVIEAHAVIGDGCEIGANSVIEYGVEIGKNCRIASSVTISHALLGNRIVIKSGARIGQKGFGFHMDESGHLDIPQLGRVIIGDDVEIGANTTIDRGAEPDTIIECGTRIDNLVQIAHNVQIGEKCVIVAQTGIAGSTQLGEFVIVAGQVGIAGHLSIGDGARIAAQSGIMRNVGKGETVAGSPAVPVTDWHRQTIAISKLGKKRNKL